MFFTEPPGYEKTVLSDLQGAWENLRAAVVEHAGFAGWERMLFHIDEAMSWETVRHLERMPPLVVLIRNLAVQGDAPAEVTDALAEIPELLQEIEQALKAGRPR
jgi:hypothetical protein